MSNYSVGDVVRLKSGGPMMTVTGRNYDNNCVCAWFDQMKEFSAIYPDAALYSEAQVQAQVQAQAERDREEMRRLSASLNDY
ncbi:YodC family protein [Aeromonas veronii]|uniref:YodC family protein n=1 Tax=Aeromonas veronii TaxID=654 RepID=UPI001F27E903|nr:DUF2158 domain-containing protein [Aeromonas veronii]UJP36311.1 YodC family protein [Aeromonas veronii]